MKKVSSGKRWIADIAGWCAFALWLGYIFLFIQYAATRPDYPQPENGRIYKINNHGSVAYLNRSENLWLWFTSGSAVTIILVVAALEQWRPPKPH